MNFLRQPKTYHRKPLFGVPQKRKRAFFFVTRRPLDPQRIDDLLARHKVPPVTTREALHGLPSPAVRPETYDDEAEVEGPANHFAMRHSKRYHRQPNTAHRQPSSLLPGPMSYRRLHPTKPANTLFSGHRAPPAHFAEPRSITVREAARLQGFPDTFRVYGSFANQMEQVTSSVLCAGRNAWLGVRYGRLETGNGAMAVQQITEYRDPTEDLTPHESLS